MILEHAVVWVVDFIAGMNRHARKPLSVVVPQFEQLCSDPVTTLKENSIKIPPYVPYGAVLCIVLSIVLCGVCGGISESLTPNTPLKQHRVLATWLLVLWMVVTPYLLWKLFSHLLRGGELHLDTDGVWLIYRRIKVFCPWELFTVPCEMRKEKGKTITCYVAPSAVPHVTVTRDELVIAAGEEIRTRPLRFNARNEVVLNSLYKVPIQECIQLLFVIGPRMASGNRPRFSV